MRARELHIWHWLQPRAERKTREAPQERVGGDGRPSPPCLLVAAKLCAEGRWAEPVGPGFPFATRFQPFPASLDRRQVVEARVGWSIEERHGEAVAVKEGRTVALEVTECGRLRLWSHDYRTWQDLIEIAWVDDDGWRTNPRFWNRGCHVGHDQGKPRAFISPKGRASG